MADGERDVSVNDDANRPDPAPLGDTTQRAPAAVLRVDTRLFRHELTPTWLATATVLAGQRPPALDRPFRVAWLGCRGLFTPAVVAAVHPDAEVWAWDPDPARVAAVGRLRDDAELSNLVVHEHPTPPAPPTAPSFDLVVLDALVDSVGDRERHALIRSVASLLRPAGLACVTYRTLVGWSEIAPVARVLRHVAYRSARDHAQSVADALALLTELDDRQVGYLATRPVVRAWVHELLRLPVDDVVAGYVHRDLQPVSHAQLVEAFAGYGVGFVGPGQPDLDLPSYAGAALAQQVRSAGSSILRETLGDLAVRRSERADLFRLGAVPEDLRTTSQRIHDLVVTRFQPGALGTEPGDPEAPSPLTAGSTDETTSDGDDERAVALTGGLDATAEAVTVGDLWPDSESPDRELLLRRALAGGFIHPVRVAGATPEAMAAAGRLTSVLAGAATPAPHRCVVAPGLGSAVAFHPPIPAARHALLGISAP